MEFQIPSFSPAAPEITVAAIGLFMLLLVSFARRSASQIAYYLTHAALLIGAGVTIFVGRDFSATVGKLYAQVPLGEFIRNIGQIALGYLGSSEPQFTFGQMYLADPLGDLLKIAVCAAVALVLVYGRRYLQDRKLESPEYYLLVLFATLGIMVLISAASLITVYVGLELLSLSSYALVAINRDSVRSTEAAMKYFVLGALASGLLLYGMSMVYGATQSLGLVDVGLALVDPQTANRTVLLFGLVFLVAGIAFKLGVVPFHMWIPDVYEGAPTAVTLFIASASKLAAFAMLCRLLAFGLWGLVDHWKLMLLFVGVSSIILGNISAIAQTNLKRMLAYSGISHMGFLLLGFASTSLNGSTIAYVSALFYALSYMLTTLAGFGVMLLMSRAGFEAEDIDDLKGLNKRSSWWAGMMAIVMFSMAGIPFFLGFFAKFFVLQALWSAGHASLAVLAVAMSLIGAFYYLRIVKVMFFDEPVNLAPIEAGRGVRTVLSANVLALAVFGLFPGFLVQLCVIVIQSVQ